MGFKVILWICPFVSPDSDVFRELERKGYFLKAKTDTTAIVKWWNGFSALLDFSNHYTHIWFEEKLHELIDFYGVDGFNMDAGDPNFYSGNIELNGLSPNDHSRLWGEIGLKIKLNEYLAIWKMGDQPLAERLHDKDHSWHYLKMLITQMLVGGIMGYSFLCPNRIGGGQFKSFLDDAEIDEELIVRYVQYQAQMLMIQFSVALWRVFDGDHLAAVNRSIEIHQTFKNYILELAKVTAFSGEPMIRPMENDCPRQGFAKIHD